MAKKEDKMFGQRLKKVQRVPIFDFKTSLAINSVDLNRRFALFGIIFYSLVTWTFDAESCIHLLEISRLKNRLLFAISRK